MTKQEAAAACKSGPRRFSIDLSDCEDPAACFTSADGQKCAELSLIDMGFIPAEDSVPVSGENEPKPTALMTDDIYARALQALLGAKLTLLN